MGNTRAFPGIRRTKGFATAGKTEYAFEFWKRWAQIVSEVVVGAQHPQTRILLADKKARALANK